MVRAKIERRDPTNTVKHTVKTGALPTANRQWVSYHRNGSIRNRGSARGGRLLDKGETREGKLRRWHG